jgi:hypothetical protein
MLESVLLNGEDVSDTGIPLQAGEPVEGVQVVLTDRLTRVSGGVTDDSGRPSRDYVAVIFPEDSGAWRRFSRRQRVEGPDQQGRFEVTKLPPGRYLAAAVEYVEDGQANDPEFLQSLRSWATPFELRKGETKTLALKLVTPG